MWGAATQGAPARGRGLLASGSVLCPPCVSEGGGLTWLARALLCSGRASSVTAPGGDSARGARLLLRPPHASHSRSPELLSDGATAPQCQTRTLSSPAQNHGQPIPGVHCLPALPPGQHPLPLTVQALLWGVSSSGAGAGEERAVLGRREPGKAVG